MPGVDPTTNRKLIICFDGTWNTPDEDVDQDGDTNTNVRKFYESVADNDDGQARQVKWYDEGVGTKWYSRLPGGALGVGLSRNIQQGYRFVVENYEEGDELFIVGFSRGAYTARSLVGLIRNAGLLRREHIKQIKAAYQLYRTRDTGADSETALYFRGQYSREIRITFLAVWDTVGALGVPLQSFEWFNRQQYEFHDCELSSIVENAFHAIAVDEHRENYSPTLWVPKAKPNQVLEQVWFIGAHSDVGGGYPERELADIALAWVQEKATQCGLALIPDRIVAPRAERALASVHDSYSDFLMGLYKKAHDRYFRLIGGTKHGSESVHDSVNQRLAGDVAYRPKNRVGEHVANVRNPGTERL